jgi:hypothetical protein
MEKVQYSQEKYRNHVSFFLDYAREDWLGFSVINPRIVNLIGREATFEQKISMMITIVSDLLDAGAKIGDFADSEGAPFMAWPGGKEESLARLENEIRALGDLLMTGDVGWITFLDH